MLLAIIPCLAVTMTVFISLQGVSGTHKGHYHDTSHKRLISLELGSVWLNFILVNHLVIIIRDDGFVALTPQSQLSIITMTAPVLLKILGRMDTSQYLRL